MTRVTDFAQNQLNLYYIGNTQQRLYDTQNQISTGYVSQNYAGIGAQSSQLVSLQSTSSRIDQYETNIQTVTQRLKQMESDTSSLSTIASNLQTLLVNGLNAETSSDLNLNQQAQDMLNQVQGILNDQLNGRYLFGGTATDQAPVDFNAPGFATPPSVYPSSPDTGYFLGNSTKLSAQVDDNLNVTYGVTADEPAIEQLVRSLRLAATANVGPPQDRNRLNEALAVAKQAVNNLPDVTSKIGTAEKALSDISAKHTNFKQFADQVTGNIENVDVTKAMTILSQDTNTLNASYAVMAKLSQLSLVHFL